MSWRFAAAAMAVTAAGWIVLAVPEGVGAAETMQSPSRLPVAGLIETAVVYPGGFRLKAKLDTGALTSSLDVDRYRLFKKDGRDMVEFMTSGDDDKPLTMSLPVARIAKVKKRGGGVTTRPVVMLDICIGKVLRRTQVSLQDRSNFLYPLLIGRRYLIGAFVVDPGRHHLQTPDCRSPKGAGQ